jgi:hypothetical protein
LSELGKAGPLAIGNAPVVRRWQVLAPNPQVLEVGRRNSVFALATDQALAWTPAYSTVSGTLPLASVPVIKIRDAAPPVGYVRFEVQITTPGDVLLEFNAAEHLTLWVDGKRQQPTTETVFDLPVGIHQFVLAIALDARDQDLRVAVEPASGSRAKFQVVSGK